MKVFFIFPILLLLTCRVLAKDKANERKKYLLGVYVLCDDLMTKQLQERNIVPGEYFGAFFNAINLIFRQLPSSTPRVRFKVAWIETTSELNYLKKVYRYIKMSDDKYLYGLWSEHINLTDGQVADTPTTKQLSQYFKNVDEPYNNSHAIVLFSGRTLYLDQMYHDWKNTDAKSRLIVHRNPRRAGICTDQNIVITQDDGFFSGITYTARRLIRLLGSNYDRAKNTTCLYRSGMLMGNISKKENYKMSPCTISELTTNLGTDSKQGCLEKKFNSSVASTRNLPADLFNTDSYCAHLFKGKDNIAGCTQEKWDVSGHPSAGTCQVRCCYGTIGSSKGSGFTMMIIDALDGYPCNADGVTDGVCVKGVCERKPSYKSKQEGGDDD